MSVTINDFGISRISKQLKRLGELKVFVGVQGAEAAEAHPDPDTDASVGQVALWNYFGTNTAPPRPWIDQGIQEVEQQAKRATAKAASDLVDGRVKTAVIALEPLGQIGAKAMEDAIDTASSWAEPLAERTIKAKGHDRPLVDSGTLRASQSYTIREGNEVLAEGKAK